MDSKEQIESSFNIIDALVQSRGDDLPHVQEAMRHIAGARQAVERMYRREQYLKETRTPAKGTILIYLEGDKNRPVRKNVLRITSRHVVTNWHEPKCQEHYFSVNDGYSLERPGENGRREPHRLDEDELAALKTGVSALRA